MGVVGGLAILLFVATMATILLTIAIWPGEAKLTAPFLCPDEQPDPFVVADTYQTEPGETSTNFTLYCMGPRGDVTDVGFFRSFAILTGFHALILVAIVALFAVLRVLQRGRRAPAAGPDHDSGGGEAGPSSAPEPRSVRSEDDETQFEPPGPVIT